MVLAVLAALAREQVPGRVQAQRAVPQEVLERVQEERPVRRARAQVPAEAVDQSTSNEAAKVHPAPQVCATKPRRPASRPISRPDGTRGPGTDVLSGPFCLFRING